MSNINIYLSSSTLKHDVFTLKRKNTVLQPFTSGAGGLWHLDSDVFVREPLMGL